VAQLVKNPPAMGEAWVQSLGWEDARGGGRAFTSLGLMEPFSSWFEQQYGQTGGGEVPSSVLHL